VRIVFLLSFVLKQFNDLMLTRWYCFRFYLFRVGLYSLFVARNKQRNQSCTGQDFLGPASSLPPSAPRYLQDWFYCLCAFWTIWIGSIGFICTPSAFDILSQIKRQCCLRFDWFGVGLYSFLVLLQLSNCFLLKCRFCVRCFYVEATPCKVAGSSLNPKGSHWNP